jgi:hypothetical protein
MFNLNHHLYALGDRRQSQAAGWRCGIVSPHRPDAVIRVPFWHWLIPHLAGCHAHLRQECVVWARIAGWHAMQVAADNRHGSKLQVGRHDMHDSFTTWLGMHLLQAYIARGNPLLA